MKSIVVYCGSKTGNNPAYAAAAQQLGFLLAKRGITLVYGGGSVGLMGVVSRTVMASGGKVIGVITKQLNTEERGNEEITELRIVDTMHERIAMMCSLCDGAIALPGAYGTLQELFDWMVMTQLRIHTKPCGLLNVDGFYDSQIAHLDRLVSDGFLAAEHRELLVVEPTPDELLAKMAEWKAARPSQPHYEAV